MTDEEQRQQERLAEYTDALILHAQQELTLAIRARAEGAAPSELADLAYALTCIEGTRRGVPLPGAPPPPKHR